MTEYERGQLDAVKACWRIAEEVKQEWRARNCGPGHDAARDIQNDIETKFKLLLRSDPIRLGGLQPVPGSASP